MNYNDLVKPVLAPPPILFPIAWTALYVLMNRTPSRVSLFLSR